jgi:hypothetical protein
MEGTRTMILTGFKNANLALMFFLELCVLAALAYWGLLIGPGMLAKIGPGIGAPVLAIVVWGLLGAPRSSWRLQELWYIVLKVIFFGSATLALFVAGSRILGVVFALVFVLNSILIAVWKQ